MPILAQSTPDARRKGKQMEPVVVNGSVHTQATSKAHKRGVYFGVKTGVSPSPGFWSVGVRPQNLKLDSGDSKCFHFKLTHISLSSVFLPQCLPQEHLL